MRLRGSRNPGLVTPIAIHAKSIENETTGGIRTYPREVNDLLMFFIKRHWPLIVAVGILWVVVGVCLIISVKQNQGHFVYALDDPYIHMAMAKNFAQHGVWGITKYGFSSSSSSLLWTLSLSFIYLLWGVNEVTPLVLNIVFGTILVFWVYFIFREYISNLFFIFVLLNLIIFSTPLPALIFIGQEHVLHTLLNVVLVYFSARVLSGEKISSFDIIKLTIMAMLVITTRYEGLFLVFVVCCLFIIRKKPLYALLLGGFGVIPVAIYGSISVSKGWYFLPNTLLLKGRIPDFSSYLDIINFFGYSIYKQILENPHILMLLLGNLIIFQFHYNRQKWIWENSILMVIIYVATTCLHLQFAKIGWCYRYEAYLVGVGMFIIGISLHRVVYPRKLKIEIDKEVLPQCIALSILILLLISPFLVRSGVSLKRILQRTKNIYEEQYQMGFFLRKFYEGNAVAANDIGAINYFADIKCLDLVGLGNMRVASAELEGHYGRNEIFEFAELEQVSIAMLYDHWYEGKIPSQWVKVGRLRNSNNVARGHGGVSFYAVDPEQKDILITNLEQFSQHLPKNVLLTKMSKD